MTGYSSETAVLKVLSVILLRIDGGDLVLLDLSAAFDTVDHHILLQPAAPERSYGITGLVRQWFLSYLVGHRQFLRTGWSISSPELILCGVPFTGVGPVHC